MNNPYSGSRDDMLEICELAKSKGFPFIIACGYPESTTSFAYTNCTHYGDFEDLLAVIKKLNDETIWEVGRNEDFK